MSAQIAYELICTAPYEQINNAAKPLIDARDKLLKIITSLNNDIS